MSTNIQGNPADISTQLSATYSGLANNGSGLIRVTTSTPHLFGNNDRVLMSGSTTGMWSITVIDATHFDLQGSTFTSGGTGSATDFSITPPFQWPTSGDPLDAQLSGLISGAQMLADRDAYIWKTVTEGLVNSAIQTYNASTSLTAPNGIRWLVIEMCGGGGGGGGGTPGGTTVGLVSAAGGGGAGAPLVTGILACTPGDTITIVVGVGGAGGGGLGILGGNGLSSSVSTTSGGTLTAKGGCGGYGATGVFSGTTNGDVYVFGGVGTDQMPNPWGTGGYATVAPNGASVPLANGDGAGGAGISSEALDVAVVAVTGGHGVFSRTGNAGGNGGLQGLAAGSMCGGGGGGGGGGGPFGVGGSGGGGGAGSAGGVGGAASTGGAVASNGGGGGGGGAGGGSGIGGGGIGSPGITGASGSVRIAYIAFHNVNP